MNFVPRLFLRLPVALAAALGFTLGTAAAGEDAVLRAMRDELARSVGASDAETVKVIKHYEEQIASYKKEQKDIEAKAKELESKRDEARKIARLSSEKGSKMGLAISFFSVAVALASICTVTKKKPLWFVALVFAGVAITQMVMAWISA